jgi:hypothetical protein
VLHAFHTTHLLRLAWLEVPHTHCLLLQLVAAAPQWSTLWA